MRAAAADGRDGGGVRGDPPRVAHGRPGQLGRDPVADPAGSRRHVLAARRRSSGADVAAGLRRATDAAYQAVLRPVEGTILTVVRSAAESVEQAVTEGETTLAGVLERAADAAREAVASTPDLLPVLREAGVVDAGGRGFELLLAACLHVVAGRPLPAAEEVHASVAVADARRRRPRRRRRRRPPLRGHVLPPGRRRRASTTSSRRGVVSATRSSSSAATASGTATCTPTTSAPPSRPASPSGRPRDIRVTDLLEQVADREEEAWVRDQTPGGTPVEHGRPPRWSRWRWATGCARCFAASACSRWWRAGSR